MIVDGSIETRTIARAGAHGGAIAVGGVLVNSVTYLATAKNVKIEREKKVQIKMTLEARITNDRS